MALRNLHRVSRTFRLVPSRIEIDCLAMSLTVWLFMSLALGQDSRPRIVESKTGVADQAHQHLTLAGTLYKEGKLDAALVEVNAALQLDPLDDRARAMRLLITMALQKSSSRHHVPEDVSQPNNTWSDVVPDHGMSVVLPRNTPIVMRLSETLSSEAHGKSPALLQIRHDVKAEGLVVLAEGSNVQYSLDIKKAGTVEEPGLLVLRFESVRSVSGAEITVIGSEVAEGERKQGCAEWVCAIPIFDTPVPFFNKGTRGILPAGILTAAYVAEDIELDRSALTKAQTERVPARQSPANSNKARVHFYYNFASISESNHSIPDASIKVDGNKIGRLHVWEYACTEVEPGTHRLRVGSEQWQVSLDREKEYFVRVQSSEGKLSVDLTNGYEIAAHPLMPGSLKERSAVECW